MSGSPEDALLGRIAIHYKLITAEQLSKALAHQQATDPRLRIGEVLHSLKLVTKEQLAWLVNAQEQYLAKMKTQGSAATPPAEQPPAAKPSAPAAPVAARPSSPAPAPAAVAQAAPAAARPSAPMAAAGSLSMEDLLARAVALKASDVHLHSGAPVQFRVNGAMKDMKTGVVSSDQALAMIHSVLDEGQRQALEQHNDLDAALQLPCGRFRANFFRQQRGWDAVLRPVPPEPPTLEQLGLPATLKRLTEFHQGLVLVTGPAGCGKSSTLAALVNLVNQERKDHIITVEDPIEYVHRSKGCVVNQRQAGKHTLSFANALRAALREDPDVIVIGELRDLETISLAITAAETGHLVMGTLHTNNAVRTINRVLDVFPPKQQSQIRAMVSESLRAIISQRLVPTADGSRRVPALEALFVKPAVSNLIREEKTFQIRSVMQTGKNEGMCLLDDSLLELVKAGTVSKEVARRNAEDPRRFQ